MYSEVIPTFLQLVALLREVKYLEQMGESSRTLPESAAAVFEKNETYRMFLQVIECVCGGGSHGTVYAASPLAPDSTFTHISLSLSLLALLALLKLYIHVHIQASTPFLFSLLHVFLFHSSMSLPLFSLFPQNLDVTVTLYNRVRSTVLEVEYPLIESQLAAIDQQLERAISELNWTSEGL